MIQRYEGSGIEIFSVDIAVNFFENVKLILTTGLQGDPPGPASRCAIPMSHKLLPQVRSFFASVIQHNLYL